MFNYHGLFFTEKIYQIIVVMNSKGSIHLLNKCAKADFHPCFQVRDNCAPLLTVKFWSFGRFL
jgi:hypothetical protein